MTIKNKFGETTSEINVDGVEQYCTYCEKYDDETNEKVWSTFLYYFEKDKDNVEAMFEDVYTRQSTPTPFSVDILRGQRKKLLEESDWTTLPDSPLNEDKKEEWKTYRQQLRDITNGIETEEQYKAVVFPTKPEDN
tara:strand:+ start:302 stop:709 length:408 start_codon:yes stop_codon:yes gene_type:complete